MGTRGGRGKIARMAGSEADPRRESRFSALRDEDVEDLSRVGRDTGIMLGGSTFGRFLGLCYNFLIARVAGEALFGLYTLSQTIINYLITLSNFGLDQALVRFVAIYRGAGDRGRMKGVLVQGFLVNLALSLAAAAGLFWLAPWVSREAFGKPELEVFLRWVAGSIPFLTLLNFFLGATQGYRQMKYTPMIRDLAFPVFKLALIALLFAAGSRLHAILFTHLASSVLWGAVALAILWRIFRPTLARERAVADGAMLRFSFPLFLNDFVMKSMRWSDVVFLGLFRGSGDIGVYKVAQITSEISRVIYQAFKTTFAPVISLLHHRGEGEALRRQFVIISKWSFAVSFPPLVFFSLLARESLSVFGRQFVTGALVLVILNFGRMVSVSTGLSANLIVMSGKSHWTLFNTVLGNGLNFALNAVLIRAYGTIGAAAAYAGSIALLNIVQMLEVRLLFGFFPYYWGYLKPLGASLVAGAAARWAWGLLPWPPPAALGVCALLFLVVYMLALLALGLPPEDRLLLKQLAERTRLHRP